MRQKYSVLCVTSYFSVVYKTKRIILLSFNRNL